MNRWTGLAAGCAATLMVVGLAAGQAKPPCDEQGRVKTPQKVEGQITAVDPAQNKVSVRAADGSVHEFQASKETLATLKVGDRIEANLREAPKCP